MTTASPASPVAPSPGPGGPGEVDTASLYSALDRVRSRLFADRLLRNLSRDLVIALVGFCGLLVADKALAFGWGWQWTLGSCLGAGVFLAVFRSICFGRVSVSEAASATDDRLGLKERVATAVFLDGSNKPGGAELSAHQRDMYGSDEWRQLIVDDGARRLDGVPIAEHFPVKPPRSARWLIPLAILPFPIVYFLPSFDLLGLGEEREAVAEEKKALKKEIEQLDTDLEKIANEAKRQGLPDFDKVLEKLQKIAQLSNEKKNDDAQAGKKAGGNEHAKKTALVQLNKREEVIRSELTQAKFQNLKQAIDSINRSDRVPLKRARELQRAIKKGDFKKALKELRKLQRELRALARKPKDKRTAEEQKRLNDLRDKLSKDLNSLSKQTQSLGQLSKSLSQASQSLSKNNMQQAMQKMDLSAQQLQKLGLTKQQLSMLQQINQRIQQSKQGLQKPSSNQKPHSCPDCGKPKPPKNPWKKNGQQKNQKPGGT
ncbi:MAG: hypothetical protein AAF517_01845 [Planctomycetota bacterium]